MVRFVSRVIRLLAKSARSRYLPSALSRNPRPTPTLSTLEDLSSPLPGSSKGPRRRLPASGTSRLRFVTKFLKLINDLFIYFKNFNFVPFKIILLFLRHFYRIFLLYRDNFVRKKRIFIIFRITSRKNKFEKNSKFKIFF